MHKVGSWSSLPIPEGCIFSEPALLQPQIWSFYLVIPVVWLSMMRMQSGKWLPSKSPAQSLEQIHMEVYGLLSSFTMSLLSDHSSLSSKPCKWQPKQKPCCFQRWYKQAHYSQRLVLLLRLGVEKGRGSFPQSKWQSRSIFKVKFLMRTLQKFFFH